MTDRYTQDDVKAALLEEPGEKGRCLPPILLDLITRCVNIQHSELCGEISVSPAAIWAATFRSMPQGDLIQLSNLSVEKLKEFLFWGLDIGLQDLAERFEDAWAEAECIYYRDKE